MNTLARDRRRGMLVTAATTCALLLTAGTAHADLDPDRLRTVTDGYLFDISLEEFESTEAQQPYADQIDWSSDSCTWSPDKPLGYFATSCDRHDFGYRNYKKQDRFSEEDRRRVDDNFKADMYSNCGDKPACKATANIYYFAVREFGAISSSTADALTKAQVTGNASGDPAKFRAVNRSGESVQIGADG